MDEMRAKPMGCLLVLSWVCQMEQTTAMMKDCLSDASSV